jgi:hypothetical protein
MTEGVVFLAMTTVVRAFLAMTDLLDFLSPWWGSTSPRWLAHT